MTPTQRSANDDVEMKLKDQLMVRLLGSDRIRSAKHSLRCVGIGIAAALGRMFRGRERCPWCGDGHLVEVSQFDPHKYCDKCGGRW